MLCCIVALAAAAFGQNYVGVEMGFAQSITRLNLPVVGQESKLEPSVYNGMKLGVVYDGTFIKGLGVSMGLNYTMGTNVTDWRQQNNGYAYPLIRSKGWHHNLELCVDWQYKFEIAQRTWLIVYTGPTIQCGLSFKEKWYMNDGKEVNFTYEDDLYSEEEMGVFALKRLNVTWGVGAGFQYDRYFVRGGYDFGIINPYKIQSFTGYDIYTRGRFDQWQVKVGVYLWEF